MHLFGAKKWRYKAIILFLRLCASFLPIALKIQALFILTDPYLPDLFQVLSTYVHILSDQKVDKMLEFMDFTYATNEVHVLSWRVETSLYGTVSLNQSHVG